MRRLDRIVIDPDRIHRDPERLTAFSSEPKGTVKSVFEREEGKAVFLGIRAGPLGRGLMPPPGYCIREGFGSLRARHGFEALQRTVSGELIFKK